jgi:hypothetical protein
MCVCVCVCMLQVRQACRGVMQLWQKRLCALEEVVEGAGWGDGGGVNGKARSGLQGSS